MIAIYSFLGFILSYFKPKKVENEIASVVYRLLRLYNIKITYSTITKYIKSDPQYPTLKSICNFFNDHSISNYALRLTESELDNLNRPFIAHLNKENGKVLLVYSINNKKVVYADALFGLNIMKKDDFFKSWRGVVILIEPVEISPEIDYSKIHGDEIIRNSIVPFSFCLLLSIIFSNYIFIQDSIFNIELILIIVLNIAGLLFSILIFRHELNYSTKFTEKLCHITKNSDCDSILKSEAAKIFGSITWAEIGIIYFLGSLMCIFILSPVKALPILAFLSICSLPYPFYSIVYQWKKLKKWCPMCIMIQAILLSEFFIMYNHIDINNIIIQAFFDFFILFSVLSIIVILFKYLIIFEKNNLELSLKLDKFNKDSSVFVNTIEKGEQFHFSDTDSVFVFGNLDSDILITIFLSPYCSGCASIFKKILQLIQIKVNAKIQLIFSPILDDLSTKLLHICYSMMKLRKKDEALKLLDIWYKTEKKEREEILINQINFCKIQEFEEIIKANKNIFTRANVEDVPEVFITGYRMPKYFSLENIRFHIKVLHERNIINAEKD